MQLDINRYRHFVDRFDMPEEQKVAMLTQVWSIIGSFVDRAFGTAPEQQLRLGKTGSQRSEQPHTSSTKALPPPEEDEVSPGEARLVFPGQPKTRLECQDPITPIYNDAAPRVPARKKRR